MLFLLAATAVADTPETPEVIYGLFGTGIGAAYTKNAGVPGSGGGTPYLFHVQAKRWTDNLYLEFDWGASVPALIGGMIELGGATPPGILRPYGRGSSLPPRVLSGIFIPNISFGGYGMVGPGALAMGATLQIHINNEPVTGSGDNIGSAEIGVEFEYMIEVGTMYLNPGLNLAKVGGAGGHLVGADLEVFQPIGGPFSIVGHIRREHRRYHEKDSPIVYRFRETYLMAGLGITL